MAVSIKRPLNNFMWAAIGRLSGALHIYEVAEGARMAAESEPFMVSVQELPSSHIDNCLHPYGKIQPSIVRKNELHRRSEFTRGYYCAVAVMLREDGSVTTSVRSLFNQGGDEKTIFAAADADDIELFREYGLLP